MSVINQMLRDLEQRRAKVPAASHYIDEINIVAKKENNYWWLVVPLLLVIITAVNFYLHHLNQPTGNSVSERHLSENLVKTAAVQKSISKPSRKELATDSAALNNQNSVRRTKQITESLEKAVFKQPSIQTTTIIKTDPRTAETDKSIVRSAIKKSITVEKTALKTPEKTFFNKQPAKKGSAELIQQARLLMSEDQNEAVKLLESKLKETTPDSDYYALLANLYQRKKRFSDAIIFYRKALEIAHYKGELWIGIALAYRGTGEMDNSEMAFKKAIRSSTISPALKQYAEQQIFK